MIKITSNEKLSAIFSLVQFKTMNLPRRNYKVKEARTIIENV
jgi:hypothetical protein